MSQNYLNNRNGFYDKSSYRSDIDTYYVDNYPTRMTSASVGACRTTSDLSYRRDLIRLRQKLEERHNRIMQEKAAFQMFNEFKENFFKSYGENSVNSQYPSIPVQPHQQQFFNLQAFPEKETYGINSAYSSNVSLASPVLSTPTVLPSSPAYHTQKQNVTNQIPLASPVLSTPTVLPSSPVYHTQTQNVTNQIPKLPTISLVEDSAYDTTTASIVKYIEHIHNLESEKEIFETVVKALVDYQKRKSMKNNTSNINVTLEQELSPTVPSKNHDFESFKEEYLKKLDDVKSVAEDIKESVADFRKQLLYQKHLEMGDKKVLTPVKDCNPVDNDGDIIAESKMANDSSHSKSLNSKGGCTVLNDIDYTLYENGMSNSTPITTEGCRKNTEKILKSESERISHHKDSKPTITNEKCETCHGYLMQKKYHENLKHFNDTTVDERTHTFSSADRQFAEQIPECKCIKYENETNDDNLTNEVVTAIVCEKIEDDENVGAKNISYPTILKSKSDHCLKHLSVEHRPMDTNVEKQSRVTHSEKPPTRCLHKISSTSKTNQQCDSSVSKQYSTSKCYFKESKVVKCVVRQQNNLFDPTMTIADDVIQNEESIDADTIVTYFVRRVKDLKDQCRKYRSMKDVLQKRVEEYSGICTKGNIISTN